MTSQEKEPLLADHRTPSDNLKLLRKVLVLVPVIFTEYVGLGIYYYTASEWINHYVKTEEFGNSSVNSQSKCDDVNKSDPNFVMFQRVEDKTALWLLYCAVANYVPAFFALIIIPSYSDTLGRRFLFICGTTGHFLKLLLTVLVVYFKLGLLYLVFASAIDGFFGGYAVINSAIYTFISDVTTRGNQRAVALTTSDATVLTGIMLSSLITGYFVKYEGFLIPLCTSLGLIALQLIFVVCVLPETHQKKNRANTISVLGNFKRTIEFYSSQAFKGKRIAYMLLLAIYFVASLTIEHRGGIELIYQLGQPFCWTTDKIGIYGTLRYAAQGIGGLILLGPMKHCLSDLSIAIISTVFNAGSFVQEAFASTDIVMYLVAVPAILSYLTIPMVKSIMSSMTPVDKQGSLFASIVTVQCATVLSATFLLNTVYASTTNIMNGFVFIVLAGIAGLAFLLLIIFAATQKVERAYNIKENFVNVNEPEITA